MSFFRLALHLIIWCVLVLAASRNVALLGVSGYNQMNSEKTAVALLFMIALYTSEVRSLLSGESTSTTLLKISSFRFMILV
jgi:hypothetical protein